MKQASWLGVACVMLVVTSCAHTYANTPVPEVTGSHGTADYNGEWKLAQGGGDPNWTTATGKDDRARYAAWFLPDAFRIDSDRQTVRVQDDSGNPILEFSLDSDYRDRSYTAQSVNADGMKARWINNRQFHVERLTADDGSIMQTYTLENRGRRLVVGIDVVLGGSPARSYRRIYSRI